MSPELLTPEDALAGMLLDLERLKPDQWEAPPLGDQARRLNLVRKVIDHLRGVADLLEMDIAAGMHEELEQVPGLGSVMRTEEMRSTWRADNSSAQMRDDVATAVANKLSTDMLTGEIDVNKRRFVLEAMRLAYEAIPAFTTLKVLGRNNLGLRMDDYRTYDKVHRIKIQEAL